MSSMASQITNLGIVYSTVYPGADQRKYQSYASPVTGEFPAQRVSNAENVSIWGRHEYTGQNMVWDFINIHVPSQTVHISWSDLPRCGIQHNNDSLIYMFIHICVCMWNIDDWYIHFAIMIGPYFTLCCYLYPILNINGRNNGMAFYSQLLSSHHTHLWIYCG